MSDSWRGRSRAVFDPFEEDDGSYRPYRTAQQGSIMNLKLEPHPSSGEPVRYIPYLQPITIELHEETHQLCLLCHSSQMVVFIEGTGLVDLADQIGEKRVKSIHAIDPDDYDAHVASNGDFITRITVEPR
jgi:hypothetical protein